MGRELIFSQVIPASDFSLNTDFCALAAYRYEKDNPLITGETYIVSWDGQEYKCVAQDGSAVIPTAVFIGNAQPVGLVGNSEPFIIGQTALIPLNFFSLTDTQPTQHSVEIYQLVEDIEPDIPDEPDVPDTPDTPEEATDGIVLCNPLGKEVIYGSYNKLLINRASGDRTIFSKGEAENVSFPADFSKGDMVLVPEKDRLFSKVTIPKPDTLSAENILQGVNIAGVVGTATGSGDRVEMEKTQLAFSFSNGMYMAQLPITRLFLNATYAVEWNGTQYSCVAKLMEFADSLILTVGNAALLGGQAEDVPFLIVQTPDMVGCITTQANETNTVGLTLNFEGGGGEKQTFLTKILSGIEQIPPLTSAETVTLVTKEELDAIGFDISRPCFFTLTPMARMYPTTSEKIIASMTLCNFVLSANGYGSSEQKNYGEIFYLTGTQSGYYVNSKTNILPVTTNIFSTANTTCPYYDTASGEIKYNAASTYKLRGQSGSASKIAITAGYFV